MDVSVDFIFGVRVGFELIPVDVSKEVFGEEAKGGLLLDIGIVSFLFVFK